MVNSATKSSRHRRYLLVAGLVAIAFYVIVPQLGDFRSSWHLLSHPNLSWTLLAIAFTALTYLAAAVTYRLLAFKPLPYGEIVLVQLAAMFINRLLPAGVGALGTNYAYLRRVQHQKVQAASVVAVNNLLGWLGHSLLLATALLIAPNRVMAVPHNHHSALIKTVVLCLFIGLILASLFARRRLSSALVEIRRQLSHYRGRPAQLLAALLSSMILTSSNVLALSACALALGVHLPFVVIMLVFSFGVSAGTATPTPGGIGGFEAGLAAALIVYNIDSASALAIALLYRLISYWLPLAAGAVAFIVCQRRRLFSVT